MTGKTSGEGIKHDLVVGDDFSEKATLNQVEPGTRGTDPQWGWLLGSASGEAREHKGWKLAPRQVESQPSKGWGAPRTLGNVILVVAWTKGKYRGAAGDQLGQGTNPTKRPWQLRPALAEWEEAIRLGMQENIFYFYIYTHICVC